MERIMYHTQEQRAKILNKPCKCTRDDAWLGDGYYFWYDELDADIWGKSSKKNTGSYEIYKAKIDCEDILDTVFNEEHYLFWLRQVEKVAKKIVKSTGEKPTLKELNDYFKEKGTWSEVTGILFQDLSTNFNFLMVKPIEYRLSKKPFVYRKRVQLAMYSINILLSFTFLMTETC